MKELESGDNTWLFACPQGHTFPAWETSIQNISANDVHSAYNREMVLPKSHSRQLVHDS